MTVKLNTLENQLPPHNKCNYRIQNKDRQGIIKRIFTALKNVFCSIRDSIYPVNPVSKTRRIHVIPTSFEVFLGKLRYGQVASDDKRVLDTDQDYQEDLAMVKEAFNQLVPHCKEERLGLKQFDYEIRLVRDPSVNAFCLPGGKMAIHTGIIQKLKDRGLRGEELKNALCFIIGHELTHANASHSIVLISLSLMIKIALCIFSRIFANLLIGSSTNTHEMHRTNNRLEPGNFQNEMEKARLERERRLKVEKSAEAIVFLGSFVFEGIRLWLSRNNEYEADSHSLAYLQKANIPFKGSKEVMRMFVDMQGLKEGTEPGKFKKFCSLFSTHPRADLRLKNVERTIKTLNQNL